MSPAAAIVTDAAEALLPPNGRMPMMRANAASVRRMDMILPTSRLVRDDTREARLDSCRDQRTPPSLVQLLAATTT
jgi:hypothetical protein